MDLLIDLIDKNRIVASIMHSYDINTRHVQRHTNMHKDTGQQHFTVKDQMSLAAAPCLSTSKHLAQIPGATVASDDAIDPVDDSNHASYVLISFTQTINRTVTIQ